MVGLSCGVALQESYVEGPEFGATYLQVLDVDPEKLEGNFLNLLEHSLDSRGVQGQS